MNKLRALWNSTVGWLDAASGWVGLLLIRLLMAYEFGSAGLNKFRASDSLYGDVPNWFANTSANFPFPFNLFSNEFNWFAVTWIEILGGFALLFGVFTRFWAASLVIVTIVAIFGVHWPDSWSSLGELWDGYRVTARDGSGNFRIPLLFIAMLLPLVFYGPGKLSADQVLARYLK